MEILPKPQIDSDGLPKRKLKSKFGTIWQRFFRRHPQLKKASVVSISAVFILSSLLVARFFLTANKVFVDGNGAAALDENVDPNLLKGEGDGRINILLIGIGGAEHQAGDLADSIMVVSIDPLSKDVAMLSIPRDLYLPIPNYGSTKINAAHAYGEQYDYPGGGPKLLSETISKNLGVPIHYFARVDFQGFKEGVDTVGGIDVQVKQAIRDYAYPDDRLSGYEPFNLDVGNHHMDGALALKYARSRYTTSDFDRSHRQQQLLTAFKDKALSITTLTNPVKLNSLLSTAGSRLRTDLEVKEILKLIEIAKQIQPTQIINASLTNAPDNYLASQNIGGASALVPKSGDFFDIRHYVRNLMLDGYLKREAATITVLNGTGHAGLAEQTAKILKSYGYKVIKTGNADRSDYRHTEIIDRTSDSKRYTLNYLTKRFGVTARREAFVEGGSDITIVVGSDYTPVE